MITCIAVMNQRGVTPHFILMELFRIFQLLVLVFWHTTIVFIQKMLQKQKNNNCSLTYQYQKQDKES